MLSEISLSSPLVIHNTLILLFFAFFLATWIPLIKRDLFFAAAYLLLYVYTVFVQIGYVNYHYLSEDLFAYFGPSVFPRYLLFVWASFLCLFVVLCLPKPAADRRPLFQITNGRSLYTPTLAVLVAVYLFEGFFLAINFDSVTYAALSSDDYTGDGSALFFIWILFFKYATLFNIAIYCSVRQWTFPRGRIALTALFLFGASVTLFIAFRTGNRTDTLAMALGIATFEFSRAHQWRFAKRIRAVAIVVSILLAAVLLMRQIELARGTASTDAPVMEQVINKDYYAPSHLLIAAMAYQYTDLMEVIRSNFCNSLILLNHPFLQFDITELINPGVTTRKAGYAFYVFTEGYLALGNLGFLYNGLVVGAGLFLWRSFSRSDNPRFNSFALALTASMLANIARGQTSYFIKYSYMCLLPAFVVYCLLNGHRLRFFVSSAIAGARTPGRLRTAAMPGARSHAFRGRRPSFRHTAAATPKRFNT